jgi:hypothetical protein
MSIRLVALALLVAANVLLGPLGIGLIHWRVSTIGINQTYGADAASLALVVPAALTAAWLWWKHHRLAAPLALGVGLATLYYAVAETLGGDYIRYAGNNERFFLLFLALIMLGWTSAARAWTALDPNPPEPPRWVGRAFAIVSILAGALVGISWTAQLVPIALTGNPSPEYLDSPSAFWTIRIVDLGFIAPIAVWTGLGLWRGRRSSTKAAYGLASFLTLQGASVFAMGAVMLWRQDPTASPVFFFALTPLVIALVTLTVGLFVSYGVAGMDDIKQQQRAATGA